MKSNMVEAMIGAVVLLVAGLFVSYTYARTDIGRASGYEYIARFNRADGLAVGADVRVSGIKVGTVTRQELDPKTFQALVRFTVAKNIALPADTFVKISSEGLLGGNYLNVEPGGLDEILEPGQEVEFATGSVDLMSLIGQAIFSATDGGKDGGKKTDAPVR
ncbi:MAG: outer membrane lipid asymmetry maintenance protein MlaD [Alphaproteobacteria bacterium]|nr:MAG: outer membrane lipid asymmetry maintenance protein MlaD [Alphaproteobacteria bacterium]